MKRRTVHIITPARHPSFDQQLWPVLVAVTVLCGISFGAVITLLRGPWMWGSLFVVPLVATGSIFLLFQLNNHLIRRSLQFAIIISLAVHLLVLIVASAMNAFESPFEPTEPKIAQQPNIRIIEISDQRASFVWEETNSRETPEPDVETPREEKPTTETKPQPVPVKETQPDIDPHVVKRKTVSETVPRKNRELSQRRRQTQNLKPQSSRQLTGQTAASRPANAPKRSPATASSSARAESIVKQSNSKPEPTDSAAAPRSAPRTDVARSSSSPRRVTPSTTSSESAPRPSSSSARVRRRSPRIPVASTSAPVAEKITVATTTAQSVSAEPSKTADQLTRRTTRSETVQPARTSQPKSELNPRTQVARTAQRRRSLPMQPSISNPDSSSLSPRRSTTAAALATSPIPIENPSRAPESKTASRELSSKTLSVSRSSAGVTGAGRSNNLDHSIGGLTSPARRPSDSARRERTESRPDDSRTLTSSQKSETRRTVGPSTLPSSTLKSDTRSMAKLAGSDHPSDRSLESAAATINSASTDSRDERSAERGTASVDVGPTKIVADQESLKRSGGGQPEVSQLNPESTRRSRDQSNLQPSLIAALGAEAIAPGSLSSAPQAMDSEIEPSAESRVAERQGGDSPVVAERGASISAGEISDAGQSEIADLAADSRQRARRSASESSWNEEDDDDENHRGRNRTRLAQAPMTNLQPGLGVSNSEGQSTAAPNSPGDSTLESTLAKVTRSSGPTPTGLGRGRSSTNAEFESESEIASQNSSSERRNRRTDAQATGLAPDAKSLPSRRRSNRSELSPAMATIAQSGQANLTAPDPSDTQESKSVSVTRDLVAAMEQAQGSRLEIDAIEGAAGLGDRPADNAGIMVRPASRESEQLQPNVTQRFRKRDFGGTPAISPDAVIAKDAFRKRAPSKIGSSGEPTTEAAIQLGLKFLARYQLPDGSWSLTGFDTSEILHRNQFDSDTAATGLALLAFQGAGYNHREFKYATQIEKAIDWLVEHQSSDGGLYVPSDPKSDAACRLYSHGIATLAITEAYGMTQDPNLKLPAQKAIDFILEAQDARHGGWRYYSDAANRSSDTSVSGWMMMALQSGRLAGLNVDDHGFDSIDDWLDAAADPENESLYRYNPFGVDAQGASRLQGRRPTASMTAVGLLMRIYSGWDRSDPRLLAGADYLLNTKLPADTTPQLRDTYYWYYATQVLKHIDGPRWERWNNRLRPLLIRSQEKSGDLAGSWHPYRPVPDRWGKFGGRIYVTTMNLLSLEVRHRMLPLYKQTRSEKKQ